MTIEQNPNTHITILDDLDSGAAFYFERKLYIKSCEYRSGLLTCVGVEEGDVKFIAPEMTVTLVNAKVVIE